MNKVDDVILTGKDKEREIKALHKREWKFPWRDCKKCVNYPCFRCIENSKANFAKYGCILYSKKET